ncbi:hypothetical protein [Oligoflexus tunisiensis]|uniref:hypothetical protein n=1 Tax=Oligoflexus tunisiensis TaxID=708132 RepID=UPI00114D29F0|nr:hypothetical protein [Oligoflexus tunisiensis]
MVDLRKSYLLSLLLMTAWTPSLQAQGKRVVTYIEDVQEERRSTRWTLTEWLRIKERMKMMDVWLAMFSDPRKDKFAPELSLQYGQSHGSSQITYGDAADFSDSTWARRETDHKKEQGHLQFWFTNLVSATTGLRTLDIDLGLEAGFINRFMVEQQTLEPAALPALTTATDKIQYSGVNLRLFGANEQDSFLVGKIGKFNRSSGLTDSPFASTSGSYYGGEMALYFLSFLGAEGEYLAFKPQVSEDAKAKASHLDYGAFLEIYNVRFIYGVYDHTWTEEKEGQRLDSRERGRMLTVRLYF